MSMNKLCGTKPGVGTGPEDSMPFQQSRVASKSILYCASELVATPYVMSNVGRPATCSEPSQLVNL